MAHDAFYALKELFEFSAASVDQFLGIIEANKFRKYFGASMEKGNLNYSCASHCWTFIGAT